MLGKPINWIPGIPISLYRITTSGSVWSTENEQYLKPQDNKGYLEVDLKYEGTRVKAKVHRLVAHAFLPAPAHSEQNEVNHIDGNRYNNNVENLEWASHSENIKHRNEVLKSDPGGKTKKPIALYDTQTKRIQVCRSHVEAIEYLECSPPTFYQALSTNTQVGSKILLIINNPEVLNDVRNQNRIEHSPRPSDQTAEQRRAGKDQESCKNNGNDSRDGRSSKGNIDPEAQVSAQAQRVLDKWRSRSGSPTEGGSLVQIHPEITEGHEEETRTQTQSGGF